MARHRDGIWDKDKQKLMSLKKKYSDNLRTKLFCI